LLLTRGKTSLSRGVPPNNGSCEIDTSDIIIFN
jgi:hypothetical protein